MTEKEREILREKEKKREERIRNRGKVMTISFDVAGRRIVHLDREFELKNSKQNY